MTRPERRERAIMLRQTAERERAAILAVLADGPATAGEVAVRTGLDRTRVRWTLERHSLRQRRRAALWYCDGWKPNPSGRGRPCLLWHEIR